MIKRIIAILLCALMFASYASADGDGTNQAAPGPHTNNRYIFNYCKFYFYGPPPETKVDIISLNNRDETAYWRPKYNDLHLDLSEYVLYYDRDIKIRANAFDVGYADISKTGKPTSRALEVLGYDTLLFKETVNQDTGVIERLEGYNNPITAPYLIMNIYKALGIELYDIFIDYESSTDEAGVYITRTNPDLYWKMFMNDHPIDYDVYNEMNVMDTSVGDSLTVMDAVSIIAQMLDFYGEPVISKQEEYMLLQVYGDDVPHDLSDDQKAAWSYLKCRGIIGEKEYTYHDNLTFDDMTELLMRVKDRDSRTNFKEVKITTTIDNKFIQHGYYPTSARLSAEPELPIVSQEVDYSSANRIDFLIEISDKMFFRLRDSSQMYYELYLSNSNKPDSKAINGSIFHGVVDNRFYHFSVPVSQLNGPMYVMPRGGGTWPSYYELPNTNGGIYASYGIDKSVVKFKNPWTFNSAYKDTFFVDKDRHSNGGYIQQGRVRANGSTYAMLLDSTLIDVEATKEALKKISADGIKVTEESVGKKSHLRITVDSSVYDKYKELSKLSKAIARSCVIKEEYKYTSVDTTAIVGLTGDKLLVSLSEAKDIGLIDGYKPLLDKDVLIIYTKNGDMVIVDNKHKVIQKGNSYLQLKEGTPLFTFEGGTYMVDFRALYGTKETGFQIKASDTGGITVTMYDNRIKDAAGKAIGEYKVGDYFFHSATQYNAYKSSTPPTEGEDSNNVKTSDDKKYNFRNNSLKYQVDLISKLDGTKVSETLLPFVSSNPLGNYIYYEEANENTGLVKQYLVVVNNPKLINKKEKQDANVPIDSLFNYVSKDIVKEYMVDVYELQTGKFNNLELIPGVGWCYKLENIGSCGDGSQDSKIEEYYNRYKSNADLMLPFTVGIDSKQGTTILLNYNYNYYGNKDTVQYVPSGGNEILPAPIGIQGLITNPEFVANISYSSMLDVKVSTSMLLYFGTQYVEYNQESKCLYTPIGNISLENYKDGQLKGLSVGVTRKFVSVDDYLNPKVYSIIPNTFSVTTSELKGVSEDSNVSLSEISLQKIFDKFDKITLDDFLNNADMYTSLTYYGVTRIIPLVILSLLIILLLISMIADNPLMQHLCDKYIDPVSILTFGNYNIHTMKSRFFMVSIIAAIAIMGFIQLGGMDKFIALCIKIYYALYDIII